MSKMPTLPHVRNADVITRVVYARSGFQRRRVDK